MRTSDPANEKYKKVHDDFLNLAVLTKSITLGEEPLTFVHESFRNKSLGESVVAFAIKGSLESPLVVLIDITFTMDGDKVCLPIAEVLLRAADGKLPRSKMQGYWTLRNAALLPIILQRKKT